MPSWLKKKKTSADGRGRVSVSGEKVYQTTDSIEDLFLAFGRTRSIRIDPLAQYIVSSVCVCVCVCVCVYEQGGGQFM